MMCPGAPERDLKNRRGVQGYFSAIPLTEINMLLRRNFLMFLHGCNLHEVLMQLQ
jgi:hypothetical protein